jgi:hypothetical protein
VNSEPAATARILFPNASVAQAKGRHFGLALEELVDLSPLKQAGVIPAESGRVAVLRKYRKSEVIVWLLAGIYWATRDMGADVWVAAANAETDSPRDARLMARVAAVEQLQSPLRVSHRALSWNPEDPSTPFYKARHWELARQWRFSELPLPGVLRLFTQKMGARVMGAPLYIPEFSRWAFPICAWLSEIPEQTLEQFQALAQHARLTAC